jgi:hypothetical protein
MADPPELALANQLHLTRMDAYLQGNRRLDFRSKLSVTARVSYAFPWPVELQRSRGPVAMARIYSEEKNG